MYIICLFSSNKPQICVLTVASNVIAFLWKGRMGIILNTLYVLHTQSNSIRRFSVQEACVCPEKFTILPWKAGNHHYHINLIISSRWISNRERWRSVKKCLEFCKIFPFYFSTSSLFSSPWKHMPMDSANEKLKEGEGQPLTTQPPVSTLIN